MNNTCTGFMEATGTIDYTFTNNFMFQMILNKNNLVLKGLISSLLHLPLEEIDSVVIENPIELGKEIDQKDFILDIRVKLNNDTTINLEMQVLNEYNWPDRSLSYLCRTFDQLYSGEDYSLLRPVIHIGILDFTLFPQSPEFYATYKLLNIKNHEVYNDKFILSVLSLKQIELATEEDKVWQIDKWSRLFSAKTWRDIKMIAENNEILTSAAESLYQYNSDWIVRERCRARQDYERHQRFLQEQSVQDKATIKEQEADLAEKEAALVEKEAALVEKEAIIEQQQKLLEEQEAIIKSLKEK